MRLSSRLLSTRAFYSSTRYPPVFFSPPVPSTLHCRLLSSSARQPTDIQLKESDLDESFVKGSGKGGQKINKVRNCVLLTHLPTGLQVRTQKTRSLDGNRRIARKLLVQKLDDYINGPLSKSSEKIEQLRRKKANRRAKSKQKYAKADIAEITEDTKEEEEKEEDEEFVGVAEHRFKANKKAT
ncbi:unnamed protein product [Peronospora destructor]|uniref:Prokaryotic-type class I peptide chain release factors domain-containing protein n=1 Tax=Peronospora destructor TaxID=86335 RepID=A0AAV0TP44_9STRA|nr:unnamed protein product [Peronospora destructor]